MNALTETNQIGRTWIFFVTDNGFQHGLTVAHSTITRFPKPYITQYEERGWEKARRELAEAVAEIREPA